MRFVTLFAVLALLGFGAAWAATPTISDVEPQKVPMHNNNGPHEPLGDLGGEGFADAAVIPSLPFTDSGWLWDYTQDVDLSAFGQGTSPDVVYTYTPTIDGCIRVDGCLSDYDQMIFIVDAATMTILTFNDESLQCAAHQSCIKAFPGVAGTQYYFVITGWGGSAGFFSVTWSDVACPPPVECPPTAGHPQYDASGLGAGNTAVMMAEGENCAASYLDTFNAGCNMTPNSFSVVPAVCDPTQTIVICGTNFNYYRSDTGGAARDTDWYLLTDLAAMGATQLIYATAYYETSGSLYFIQILDPCAASIPYGVHLDTFELGYSDETWITDAGPGIRWCIFMSKNYYDPTWWPCTDGIGWPYVLTIDDYVIGITANDADSWSKVKNLFK